MFAVVVFFMAAGQSHSASVSKLVNQRLAYMSEVAAWKFNQNQPIEDLERERVVIERSIEEALQFGITVQSSERLFSLQIDAAKEIQRYWFKRWKGSRPPEATLDLVTQIRPRLLDLGDAIVRGLAQGDIEPSQTISIRGLSRATAQALEKAIEQVGFYRDRLDQVVSSGVLRVGTTGDYAPFSLLVDASSSSPLFEGIDIDLAHDLAKSLDVRVVFIQTSWPTLMQDLAAGRFDIGMSGISRSLERQRQAYFSVPYLEGGKTPLARCEVKDAYESLQAIDQPGVRVIVNPGGTNQQFVADNIRAASVTVHNDNRTIFEEIIQHRADVMITDRIEVTLQTHRHPQLCSTMPGNLTYLEKGYLLPVDAGLKAYVDLWLELRLGGGEVASAIARHTSS
ncbi:MAG: gamma subclass chorismate mutase AroQ [Proteobacteria bacterium]|nr:gamma subclass chorismate mutase AroQ [Pseudomonadota bacterium]